ncbi:hypothetical protein GCM10027174_45250 [Salinifilum aidingensis]
MVMVAGRSGGAFSECWGGVVASPTSKGPASEGPASEGTAPVRGTSAEERDNGIGRVLQRGEGSQQSRLDASVGGLRAQDR